MYIQAKSCIIGSRVFVLLNKTVHITILTFQQKSQHRDNRIYDY